MRKLFTKRSLLHTIICITYAAGVILYCSNNSLSVAWGTPGDYILYDAYDAHDSSLSMTKVPCNGKICNSPCYTLNVSTCQCDLIGTSKGDCADTGGSNSNPDSEPDSVSNQQKNVTSGKNPNITQRGIIQIYHRK